jgi:ketosteroid isomerase-like protein
MERSIEIEDIMRDLYKALSSADQSSYSRRIAQRDEALYVSNAPEWRFEGYKTIIEMLNGATEQAKGHEYINSNPRAYCEGKVGWAADEFIVRFPDGQELNWRVTMTFIQENGEWKIIQWHDHIMPQGE